MMHRSKLRTATALLAVSAVALMATGCSGSDKDDGDLRVENARVDYPLNPDVAAVRMDIVNDTGTDDTLTAVSSPDADASIHLSTTSGDGQASMDHVTELPIPAGETTEFAPGGLHIMLNDPTTDLEVGDTVELTLVFANAGEQRLTVPVVEPGSMPDADEGS